MYLFLFFFFDVLFVAHVFFIFFIFLFNYFFILYYLLCIYLFFCFFFFKQKTAYEMRISDWSSDVCSSDLPGTGPGRLQSQDGLKAAGRKPRAPPREGRCRTRQARSSDCCRKRSPPLRRRDRPGNLCWSG